MLLIYEKFENHLALIHAIARWDEFDTWREAWQAQNPKSDLIVMSGIHYPAGGAPPRMP